MIPGGLLATSIALGSKIDDDDGSQSVRCTQSGNSAASPLRWLQRGRPDISRDSRDSAAIQRDSVQKTAIFVQKAEVDQIGRLKFGGGTALSVHQYLALYPYTADDCLGGHP